MKILYYFSAIGLSVELSLSSHANGYLITRNYHRGLIKMKYMYHVHMNFIGYFIMPHGDEAFWFYALFSYFNMTTAAPWWFSFFHYLIYLQTI